MKKREILFITYIIYGKWGYTLCQIWVKHFHYDTHVAYRGKAALKSFVTRIGKNISSVDECNNSKYPKRVLIFNGCIITR